MRDEQPQWWRDGIKEKTVKIYGTMHYPVCTYATFGSGACTCQSIDKGKRISALEDALREVRAWLKPSSVIEFDQLWGHLIGEEVHAELY